MGKQLTFANAKEMIAERVSREIKYGYIVNLGIGLPTLIANYVPEELDVSFQAENGIIGMAGISTPETLDPNTVNSAGVNVDVYPGAAFFDSATSFCIIRGGHVDMTVLGALEVDQYGNIASHIIPGKMAPGMGGAMDLVLGAKKVVVAMIHTNKGKPKLLKHITLPATALRAVDLIVTDMGMIEVTDKGFKLLETAPDVTVEEIVAATDAPLIIPDNLKLMADVSADEIAKGSLPLDDENIAKETI